MKKIIQATEAYYVIRELDGDCKITNLRLTQEDGALAGYLKRNSRQHHDESISKTYVVVDANAPAPRPIVGYITILNSEIVNGATKVEALGEGYTFHWPSVKIARLAMDERLRGRKLGKDLVSFVVAMVTREIMPRVGCRFLVVDSNRTAIPFYEKMGFTLVNTEENRSQEHPVMFLDLHKLKKAEAAKNAEAAGSAAQ